MKGALADTSFFVAYLNAQDEHHAGALDYMTRYPHPMLTTRWVLVELGNYLAQTQSRRLLPRLLAEWLADRRARLIGRERPLFERGLALYERRADQTWSLTDCISFALMRERGITQALTADRHFEQAGFERLLR